MSATQIRTFQKFTMTKLKMKFLSEVSHYNINLPMAIFTSTNNISPNSSESFYIDSQSPPLISMATSLLYNTASGNPGSSVMFNKCLEGEGGSWLSHFGQTQAQDSQEHYEEVRTRRQGTSKNGQVPGKSLFYIENRCRKLSTWNQCMSENTWRYPRLSLGSPVLQWPGLFKG